MLKLASFVFLLFASAACSSVDSVQKGYKTISQVRANPVSSEGARIQVVAYLVSVKGVRDYLLLEQPKFSSFSRMHKSQIALALTGVAENITLDSCINAWVLVSGRYSTHVHGPYQDGLNVELLVNLETGDVCPTGDPTVVDESSKSSLDETRENRGQPRF